MQQVLAYLSHLDSPSAHADLVMPEDFKAQLELFETAEYLGLDELKIRVVNEGIMTKGQFKQFTNVRRHYLDNLSEELLPNVSSA